MVYRRVLRYYSGEEDGLGKHLQCQISRHTYSKFVAYYGALLPVYVFAPDMRKALSQDVEKKSIIPLKRPITPDELEYD